MGDLGGESWDRLGRQASDEGGTSSGSHHIVRI